MNEAAEFLENRNRERIQDARLERTILRAQCAMAGLDHEKIFRPRTFKHEGGPGE